ncbi:MAG: [FeFe] hydrogenase H-cluster maturation GTPase HydF, partial [Sutterella sp.]
MMNTPKGLRLHIGLFGKRNAGKSSLVNALTNQRISIVSDVAGTTTDPVEKACELAPIGPVVFIDTAGIDDVGELGAARVERTKSVLDWVDIALIVTSSNQYDKNDEKLISQAKALRTPAVLVLNKSDISPVSECSLNSFRTHGLPVVVTDAAARTGIEDLRKAIIELAADRIPEDKLLAGDLAGAGDTVILVTPIDTGAPKGRLILPQVQAIRELLDSHAKCFVVQQDRVAECISELKHPPKLVMTDSQAIVDVAAQTPETVPLTTFSIQMAYAKADVVAMARGAAALA